MISLTSPGCADTDDLCNNVYKTTHSQWLADAANWLIAKPAAILVLVLLGLLARYLVHKLINRLAGRAAIGLLPDQWSNGRFAKTLDPTPLAPTYVARRRQRADTMAGVLRSITSFVIATIVAIMVVAELGYDVGPLLAGAGIFGLAIGFGAQSLVKDFLSGIFMAFEDQLGVGDTVLVNEVSGVVDAITLRVTRIRAEDGTIWYVRNGEILKVGNLSQS